jgi:hypothetical protein
MQRRKIHILICLLFCACTAFAHAEDVLRSLSCPWWKTGSPYVLAEREAEPACCKAGMCSSKVFEPPWQDMDNPADKDPDDCGCGRGCCKTFQPMVCLTTVPDLSHKPLDYPSVLVMNQSLPRSNFASTLFRPPQV